MTETVRIEKMAWQQFAAAVERCPAAIIPVGALEPHGRHAPLGTDPYIAHEIALRLGEATGALVHPALPVGPMDVGYEFLDLPGAISVDPKIVIDLIVNIGCELHRNGIRRIVLVNGHGPNAAPLTLAAFEIRRKCGAQVGMLDWWSAAGNVVADIKGFGYATHGDEIETSLVLATPHGDEIDLSEAVANPLHLEGLESPERDLYLRKIVFTRKMDHRYVGESGNMGDPCGATAEKGDLIMDATVEVGKLLLDVLERQDHLGGDGDAS
jgi:creatinine amidohydrolase